MGLSSLALFMIGMWVMILAAAAFLVAFVASIDHYLGQVGRLIVSAVQAAIAIMIVLALVFGLSKMKRLYMKKKLGQ